MLGYETAVKGTGVFAFLQLGSAGGTPQRNDTTNDCDCNKTSDSLQK